MNHRNRVSGTRTGPCERPLQQPTQQARNTQALTPSTQIYTNLHKSTQIYTINTLVVRLTKRLPQVDRTLRTSWWRRISRPSQETFKYEPP
jgi:hypothetical protein